MDHRVIINRYEHGGARIYLESADGKRDLVCDLYDDGLALRREKIIAALEKEGCLVPRTRLADEAFAGLPEHLHPNTNS